jgi:hypothetical protein
MKFAKNNTLKRILAFDKLPAICSRNLFIYSIGAVTLQFKKRTVTTYATV